MTGIKENDLEARKECKEDINCVDVCMPKGDCPNIYSARKNSGIFLCTIVIEMKSCGE